MKNLKQLFILLISLVLINCNREKDDEQDDNSGNYHVVMKVNGETWKGNGQAAINDKNGNTQNKFMLLGASTDDNQSGVIEFNSMLSGANLSVGKTIIMKGGFNNGEYLGLNYKGKDYVTNKAPDNLEVGLIIIKSYNDHITGQFSGTLYAETGEKIVITEGYFNLPVHHF